MSEKSPNSDELIRLIQRKKAPAKLTPDAKIVSQKTPLHEGQHGYIADLLGVLAQTPGSFSPMWTAMQQLMTPVAPEPVVPAAPSAPLITEIEIQQEVVRQDKLARVRFRIKREIGEYSSNYGAHAPEYGPEQLHEVRCSKILWSIPLPGDREREVVQCAAGIDVETPVPWIPGIARVRLGCFPCVLFGFSYMTESGHVGTVNWPEGFTKS